jgi:hypothetical protein
MRLDAGTSLDLALFEAARYRTLPRFIGHPIELLLLRAAPPTRGRPALSSSQQESDLISLSFDI